MKDAALVRLPPDLAASVAVAATADKLSVAAWLRARAVAALGSSEEALRPTRPRRRLPPPDVVAIAKLREAVVLAMEALDRSTARTREQGDTDLHADIEALVNTFRTHALELDTLKARLMAYSGVRR